MQKMMTKAIERRVSGLYETEGMGGMATVWGHWFSCWTNWDWYMVEYDPETGDAFGLVSAGDVELGYFNVREFEDLNRRHGFEVIERDTGWSPVPLRQVAEKFAARMA